MSLLSNTRRFRRPLLAAAVIAAGILAVGGATAPAKAQYYPGYSPYGGYCDPYNPYGCGGYGYGYPYAYGYGYGYPYGYGYGYPFYGAGFGYGFGGHRGFRGGFHGGGFHGGGFHGGGFRGGGGGFRGGGGGFRGGGGHR
jgi:hypothetical protein